MNVHLLCATRAHKLRASRPGIEKPIVAEVDWYHAKLDCVVHGKFSSARGPTITNQNGGLVHQEIAMKLSRGGITAFTDRVGVRVLGDGDSANRRRVA